MAKVFFFFSFQELDSSCAWFLLIGTPVFPPFWLLLSHINSRKISRRVHGHTKVLEL